MTQASFIATCLLNANRLPKHSCAFQSQHLLSRCIYCSRYLSCARRYSAEYFSPCAPHRSLREPLLQLRCHHLALATQLALAQKALFLRFTFSFTSLIPCPLPPRDEREKTERTTAQLPANKKCCLLIFSIAIGCLVLGDFPPNISRLDTLHSTLHTSALLLASTPAEGAQPAHCALHLAQRLNCGLAAILYTLKSHNFNNFCDFICTYQKNVVYLRL